MILLGPLVLGWYLWGGVLPSLWGLAPVGMVLASFEQGNSEAGAELAARFEAGKLDGAEADKFFKDALSVDANAVVVSGGTDEGTWQILIPVVVRIPGVMQPRWKVRAADWKLSADGKVITAHDRETVRVGNVPLNDVIRLQTPEDLSGVNELVITLRLELLRGGLGLNSGGSPLHVWNVEVRPPTPDFATRPP